MNQYIDQLIMLLSKYSIQDAKRKVCDSSLDPSVKSILLNYYEKQEVLLGDPIKEVHGDLTGLDLSNFD